MTVLTSNRRRRFFWSILVSNRERLSFKIVIRDRFTFVLMFRLWFAFALSRSYHLCRLQNDQVFCQMISKRSSSLRSNFLNFVSRLKFLFRIQFVHAKTTFSCDRRYYKRRVDDRWEWSTSDVTVWFSLSERKSFRFCRSHSSSSTISVACSHLSLSSVFVES